MVSVLFCLSAADSGILPGAPGTVSGGKPETAGASCSSARMAPPSTLHLPLLHVFTVLESVSEAERDTEQDTL